MVRHEAAEALGALGDVGSLGLLRERLGDGGEKGVVRETCEIAVGRIEWARGKGREGERLRERFVPHCLITIGMEWVLMRGSDFTSVDPAPPLALNERACSIDEMREQLLDLQLPLFDRYRAMFALRDLASPPDLPTAVLAVKALAAGFVDPSALFRHEIAFVFGQLSHPASIPSLKTTLANRGEESMVRHEAAEALGSLGEEEGVEEFLRNFLQDEERVVRESVVVALDMAEFERGKEREYAALPDEKGWPGEMGVSPWVAGKG